jgi:hypothetical protein
MSLEEVTQLAGQISELRAKKSALSKQVDVINDVLGPLEAKLVDQLSGTGVQLISLDGMTYYRQRDLSMRSATGDNLDVIKALIALDQLAFTTPSWQSLRAYAKSQMVDQASGEWEIDPSRLPEPLAKVVTMEEFARLGVRRA